MELWELIVCYDDNTWKIESVKVNPKKEKDSEVYDNFIKRKTKEGFSIVAVSLYNVVNISNDYN